MGFRGPAFRTVRSDTRPRFVRRHLLDTALALKAGKNTRRVRRAVARMDREAKRLGFM